MGGGTISMVQGFSRMNRRADERRRGVDGYICNFDHVDCAQYSIFIYMVHGAERRACKFFGSSLFDMGRRKE